MFPFFYVHPFIQMMQIGSAVWTGLTLMTMLLLAQWDMGCWGMTLNSVPLRPASPKPITASLGASLQRHKRNWVWNQFFVLEEYTGDDPLYVGKVRQNISSGSDIMMYRVPRSFLMTTRAEHCCLIIIFILCFIH